LPAEGEGGVIGRKGKGGRGSAFFVQKERARLVVERKGGKAGWSFPGEEGEGRFGDRRGRGEREKPVSGGEKKEVAIYQEKKKKGGKASSNLTRKRGGDSILRSQGARGEREPVFFQVGGEKLTLPFYEKEEKSTRSVGEKRKKRKGVFSLQRKKRKGEGTFHSPLSQKEKTGIKGGFQFMRKGEGKRKKKIRAFIF